MVLHNGYEMRAAPCCIETTSYGSEKVNPPTLLSKNQCQSEACSIDKENRSGMLLIIHENSNPVSCFAISTFSCMFCEDVKSPKDFALLSSDKYSSVNIRLSKYGHKDVRTNAVPVVTWKCHKFSKSFLRIFSPNEDWKYPYESSNESSQQQKVNGNDLKIQEKISWFILFGVDCRQLFSQTDIWDWTSKITSKYTSELRSGLPVLTRSFPFGPTTLEMFADTVSAGVISNISERDPSVFLIDARCLPGSEGGGVYLKNASTNDHQLIGLIIVPLCWKKEELIGFTVCCTIDVIISSLYDVISGVANHEKKIMTKQLLDAKSFSKMWMREKKTSVSRDFTSHISEPDVFKVDVAGSWGSGIVVAAKLHESTAEVYLLTCRHVIERAIENNSVIHVRGMKKSFLGRILFASDADSCYDLALVSFRCSKALINMLYLDEVKCPDFERVFVVPHASIANEFVKGDSVYVKGYALFDEKSNLGPIFSHGIISNVVSGDFTSLLPKTGSYRTDHMQPILLHSTCAVHKGASGGALFSSTSKKLLGIVVNHIRDESTGVTFPDANFSIPTCVFMRPVMDYVVNGDLQMVKCLNYCNNESTRIWSLQELPSDNKNMIRSKL